MSATTLAAFIARCRKLCRPREHVTDVELLRRFTAQRDADAFGQLLERYASLVWGICRRILPVESDCEDAFQATFLALVRRPDAIDPNQALGAWLHTVAFRVARKSLLRSQRQLPLPALPERATASDVADEVGSRELCRIVDEEIERLPIAVREPLILCCLQGRTRDEAAAALGCSVAAVKSRLERGRNLLRRSLERRGVELPAAFLALGLTSERIRAALWAKTMQSALCTPAPALAALADAGVSAVTIGKHKLLLAALLLAASAAGAVGSLLTEEPQQKQALPQTRAVGAEKEKETPPVRRDRHGDPLPDGAIARLGTVRWRHGFFIDSLAYSPDGKKIAAVTFGHALTLWDAATGKAICRISELTQRDGLAFSPDSKTIATTGNPDCYLWDAATGKEIRRLKGHPGVIFRVAFSPSGKQVATGGDDGTVRLWDAATGKEQRRIDCNFRESSQLAYSPDGKSIVSSSIDGTIHFWDLATGKEQRRFSGHKKALWGFSFSRDGKRLTSLSSDETIRCWDVATGRPLRVLPTKEIEFDWPLAHSLNGTSLAWRHRDDTIRLWDVEEGVEKHRWQVGSRDIRRIALSPDGKSLASGTDWGIIGLWDVATGRERHPTEEPHGFIDWVRFSSNGSTLVSMDSDRRLLWWDLATQSLQRQFSWTANIRRGAALSPDGNTLVVGELSDRKPRQWEVRLWDVRTGKPGRVLGKLKSYAVNFAFSPDGRLVAAGSHEQPKDASDHLIHLWDVGSGKEMQQIKDVLKDGPFGGIYPCFSPDSKALACAILDPDGGKPGLRLWDIASGKERAHFAVGNQETSQGTPLAFSPDGRVLASSTGYGETNRVHLWDTVSGKELCRYAGHPQWILALAFSPDGKLIATSARVFGNKDNSIHIWEAATGRLIRRFEGHHSFVSSLAFSPDGLSVASGSGDSTILLWDITGRRPDGHWHAKPLTPHQLEACWTALANEDAAKAYDAVWTLVAAPEQAVPLLRKHLPPVPRPDAKAVSRHIADLDSANFEVRRKATDELSQFGDAITPALKQVLDGKPSLEMRRRLQQLLDQSRDWTPERLRVHRGIQSLEHMNTRLSHALLQVLTDGAAGSQRTEEAKAALRRRSK